MFEYNTVEEAVKDLQDGKLILVSDDESRENEGDLICAAEFATTENVNFMATYGKGLICNQHLDLGFYLTEFHKFWCLCISAGGYQEIRKKGPHVGFT